MKSMKNYHQSDAGASQVKFYGKERDEEAAPDRLQEVRHGSGSLTRGFMEDRPVTQQYNNIFAAKK